ncbi:unnamed protein product [Dicrocoelium dendriticum]|nr:unnamed protein product [Dicrocoelium dendriticum]
MKRAKQIRELTEEERSVVVAVRHCAGELNDILQGARRKAQSNARLFAESGVSVMFRGLDSYADMYEKLNVKSREGLGRLFSKFADCEEVQDAQDAIEETEGNWRNFLSNLDREVPRYHGCVSSSESPVQRKKCDYFITSHYSLIDMHTGKEVTLGDYVSRSTCVFVTFQPAYWPDTCVRWRHAEITKVKADLTQFNVNFVVVTWGPADIVRSWSKMLYRATKWPVLWDKENKLCAKFGFRSGLEQMWAAENLDFLGCQKAVYNRAVNPPPTDFNWLDWCQIGGEAIIARPICWDPKAVQKPVVQDEKTKLTSLKRSHADHDSTENEDILEAIEEAARDKKAAQCGETKVCTLHISKHMADLMPPGSIYQSALTCYARLFNTTEAIVIDQIRRNRRFSTAPESARLQYETTTGLYYDPETSLYYDAARGYFYDSATHTYYYWSQSEHRYIPANALIQAELNAVRAEQTKAAEAANARAVAEREAAMKAAMRVAAELAEVRARKDDYAAYVYATCVIPQQEMNPMDSSRSINSEKTLISAYRNTAAAASNIECSLRRWDDWKPGPLVPYTDDTSGLELSHNSSTPPPPGL